ncbi:sperm-associated antigen 5 [Tiliqua scincoides]|uniref:sperm-associated antigen 5 n=1 Tax=Tiliqua scincoides TaxID=71010 RepID=UPI0034619022
MGFMEQESQVVRYQLTETEEELKATLSTLRERSTHLEDLKDNYKKLQQEQEVVVKELASTKAELQSAEVSMAKFYKTLLEIRAVQAQFLEMADILKAALQGKVMDVPQRSRPCTPAWQTPHRLGAYTPAWQTPHRLAAYTPAWQTPHRLGASLVDSILQAAAEKDVETPTSLRSDSSAFTKATPAIPPTPAEVEESLADSLLELQEAAAQLHVLICQHQKAKQEEVQDLQAENLRLEHLLESQRLQLQAELDSHDVNIAKLSKALRVRIQNEKELQDALQKQDERLQLLMDQSGEVANLQEEVAQQKRALQKAETEALALWEELKGTKPSTVDYVQEKIWLQQEVLKLRELLLAKGNENAELVANYQSQVKSLEDRLRQTQQVLRQHRKAEVEVREVLSSLPADVTSTPEIRHFLEFFY